MNDRIKEHHKVNLCNCIGAWKISDEEVRAKIDDFGIEVLDLLHRENYVRVIPEGILCLTTKGKNFILDHSGIRSQMRP